MLRLWVSCLALLAIQVACVTPARITQDGIEHEALGYKIPLVSGTTHFINDRWILDKKAKSQSVQAESVNGFKDSVRFRSFDLILDHKETKGVIAVQSFPLEAVTADRKLEIMAK